MPCSLRLSQHQYFPKTTPPTEHQHCNPEHKTKHYKMLRRKPTAITLTTEDIATYEDQRAREAHLREQAEYQARLLAQQQAAAAGTPQNKNQNMRDPGDELRPLPVGDRNRVKTREERLGLVGGGSRH
ncbi:hypothetical protein GLAREA_00923 [Glarea lozoyensis ATCC 20868]|uniref:Anaphase-promoting complex, subunit CDC26 n=1 Tax=Glarea lozoyensis (strain ATCC 20868 / MF5171) TaxID=1116229 RepID=S3DTP1_GLAL2|nr:uncharacterized protein GLAREA_00923 [Glarea lozoyensis ATCC 20868]EPE29763.1 hypothetical protein GLAREA_00923 [Glarea lozoyensis ATCC 20868]